MNILVILIWVWWGELDLHTFKPIMDKQPLSLSFDDEVWINSSSFHSFDPYQNHATW